MRLVFIGPPGAGKGTQAGRISKFYGLKHASTGEIFRQAVAEDTQLGRTVRQYVDGGKLVPDELTSEVVERMVLGPCEDFILDGYPRTLAQAQNLDGALHNIGASLDGVLYFHLDDEQCLQRLAGRLVCPQCGANYHREFMPPRVAGVCDECGGKLKVRSDSSRQVVGKRLREYHEKTQPLIARYRKRGLLQTIDASGSPEAVAGAACQVLERLRSAGAGKS